MSTPSGLNRSLKRKIEQADQSWQKKIYHIIYEAETKSGRIFDLLLLFCIFVSLAVVCLESVKEVEQAWGSLLRLVEWCITIIFTVEYILRLICVKFPRHYALSFFGLVDLLSILPSYLSLYFVGSQSLLVIRAIRLLRVFRVLKLQQFVGESVHIVSALKASRDKILVFISGVMVLVLIFGALMYLIEGEQSGFTSIPKSMYWAIVTMTTVGYGDMTPLTNLGKLIASMIMILGYGILAVPTGIVSSEFNRVNRVNVSTRVCQACMREGHELDAKFCRFCATELL